MRADRIRTLLKTLSHGLYEKEEILRLAVLALIAGENLFLYGPPGTAKSMVARRILLALHGGQGFEYLLGPFSTPEELFGPVSIARLKNDDRYERVTEGFLPSADIAFLDEIWNASGPILNTLLSAINERRFRNGSETVTLPLKLVIGAAGTAAPDDAALANLWDRFLVRVETAPVESDDSFVGLLTDTGTATLSLPVDSAPLSGDELDEWRDSKNEVSIPEDILEFIVDIRERINRHNRMKDDSFRPIAVSDRRWKQIANLLRTSAYLNDRHAVDLYDCILMRHCLWSQPDERDVVNTIVEEALFRYSTSGQFDANAFQTRLMNVQKDLRSERYRTHREAEIAPVEYRGEYYRILDYVEDHLTLIWIGDYQNLSTETPVETDLFFYGDEEDYAYSERFPIRLVDAVTVEIADEQFPVETETVERDREIPVDLTDTVRDALRHRLTELRSETDSVIQEIEKYREASTSEAARHLFVHRSYASIVERAMDQAAREFATLQLEIDDALREID